MTDTKTRIDGPVASRVIRVDAEVYALIRRKSRPLADTPNSTLRRLLGMDTNAVRTVYPPTRRATKKTS